MCDWKKNTRVLHFNNCNKIIIFLYVALSSLCSCSKPQENSFANINESSTKDQLKQRHLHFLLAQQEAKCLQEFGELEPAKSIEFPQDLFRSFVCLKGSQNFSACDQCIKIVLQVRVSDTISHGNEKVRNDEGAGSGESIVGGGCNQKECSLKIPSSKVNRMGNATSGVDRLTNNTLTTNVFCEAVTQPGSKTDKTFNSALKSLQNESNYRHFVYLKSLFRDANVAVSKAPTVFVVEQREFEVMSNGSQPDVNGKWSSWRVLGKGPHGFDKIQVAYRQQTYQWRVTAVGPQGPFAVSTLKPFKTLDGYMEPSPPRHVFVIENKPKESTVDVLLGWDPPKERACFYKIVLETRNDEEFSRTVRIKGEPSGVHKVWFRDLKFDSTYEARITTRSAEWHDDESTHASLSFTTPACLDAHQFRFDKCAPPSPRNLAYKVEAMGYSKMLDVLGSPTSPVKRYFTAHLKWDSPNHTSMTNLIDKYVVDIRAFSWNAHRNSKSQPKYANIRSEMVDPQELLAPIRISLPGNVTNVKVEDLDMKAEYTILVSAVSLKGASNPATLTIKLDSKIGSLTATIGFWVYPCGVLVTVLVIASGCQAVKRLSTRRQIKAARDSYFKTIDQRDAYTEDWSMVSLTEDPNRTWKILEENSISKAKWHVGFQDLTLGDIIGQGAFGIVRKAKIKSDKLLELQKRQNRKAFDSRYPVCCSHFGDDETEMETVALKMLRVASAKADREDLMKELMTMQSLGVHPQIVTLLGVCTTPKSMYLVLEYCPGGDLLSFLRKEKHLPILNLEFGSGSRVCSDNEAIESFSRVGNPINTSSRRIEATREQVCYTQLHHNEISTSSPELSNEMQAVVRMEVETESAARSGAGTPEWEGISEKDVVSYARQIALGMAYLERNHVIHRDLACRNVLVMADHKRVKISDFGLSRDIYTWNVYEQKTGAKMPFKWMALESITSRIFTSKSDVWSYGIVLWELVTLGAVPYPALENQQLFNMLRTGHRMERPDNCSEELYALMRKCWRTAPADRPNFIELISYLETMVDTEPELYLTLQP